MELYYLFEKIVLKERIQEAWPRLKVCGGSETYSLEVLRIEVKLL